MPYKIGLTGGIGSGKSTVARAFSELGVAIFSADTIGHELSAKDHPGYLKIIETFGTAILKADGELDRAALGDIIFNDKVLKLRLENILHPLIMHEMHRCADAVDAPYCVLDIPLLINTVEADRVDRILVVYCDLEIRIPRIRKRNNWSEEKIAKVMENQVSDQALLEAADDVLDNSSDLDMVRQQVEELHKQYLLRAGQAGY